MAAPLAHELAHAVTGAACAEMPRDRHEVVAESVAYAVGSHFGLDLALRSAHYVASWLDEPETFKATMTAIHDGAAIPPDARGLQSRDPLATWHMGKLPHFPGCPARGRGDVRRRRGERRGTVRLGTRVDAETDRLRITLHTGRPRAAGLLTLGVPRAGGRPPRPAPTVRRIAGGREALPHLAAARCARDHGTRTRVVSGLTGTGIMPDAATGIRCPR